MRTAAMNNSPFVADRSSVRSVMLRVALALVPAIAAYVALYGAAILVQLALASVVSLACEAAVLRLRHKPVAVFVTDGSALVTAWLIALSLPPIVPWWLTALACVAAIVIAKQLYGGLGQNPFNPAMAAFALMIVAYPQILSKWPSLANADFAAHWHAILGEPVVDALTMATPLDALRTAWHAGGEAAVSATITDARIIGELGGRGWEWIALAYIVGGIYLLQQRIIGWHLPAAFLGTLAALAGAFHAIDAARYAGPLIHLFSGGTMLAAFFIITDPVSGCTTTRGKLIFGASVAIIAWVIRTFGAYPDGIAFGVLLLNIAAPLIDMKTQPPVFGHKRQAHDGKSGGSP